MLYFENKALSTGKYQCRSVGNGHNQNGKVRNYKDNLQATNKNTSLAAPGHSRNACKTQNGHQGGLKLLTGSGKGSIPRFLGAAVNFPSRRFFDPSTPYTRRGSDGEKKEKEKKKIMTFLVATNVVASRWPEQRPTVTPTARAYLEGTNQSQGGGTKYT